MLHHVKRGWWGFGTRDLRILAAVWAGIPVEVTQETGVFPLCGRAATRQPGKQWTYSAYRGKERLSYMSKVYISRKLYNYICRKCYARCFYHQNFDAFQKSKFKNWLFVIVPKVGGHIEQFLFEDFLCSTILTM